MDISWWILRKCMDAIRSSWLVLLLVYLVNKFTGKDKFLKAKTKYEELESWFAETKADYKRKLDNILSEINLHIQSINASKIKIKTILFPEFAKKIKCIKNINVSNFLIKESLVYSTLTVDEIRTREELFLINFEKNTFKTNLQALLTFGCKTRAKANDTLRNIETEESRLKEESAKMDSEIKKLYPIQKVLEQNEVYFRFLIDIYSVLMNRLDNSIRFLMISRSVKGDFSDKSKMAINELPLLQQEETKAMISISLIMKKMVETRITLDASCESVSDVMREYFEQVNNLYNAV